MNPILITDGVGPAFVIEPLFELHVLPQKF